LKAEKMGWSENLCKMATENVRGRILPAISTGKK